MSRRSRSSVVSYTSFYDDLPWGFFPAALLHLIMLFTRSRIFRMECDPDCSDILYFDIPVSLFYFFLSDSGIIVASFLLGTILWGVYGWLALKILKALYGTIFNSRASSSRRRR